ncbi:MAG: DUF4270 domain-containing protein [Bacteroidales bacterium]|jgi:hypothetical protein|nr:DUF4270 domain-containing protein [Bacteroidales bacterium]
MFNKLKYLLILLPFAFLSCVDEDETLGLNLVNQEPFLYEQYDGLTMHSSFFHEDSIATSKSDLYSLGKYKDNAFGSVQSVIYTQLSLPNDIDFSQTTIDSIVLGLYFTDYYTQDTAIRTMNMQVEIRELANDIPDTAYAFDVVDIDAGKQPLFNNNTMFNPDTIIVLGEDTLTKQLRLPLSDDFKARMQQQSFADNSAFQQWLKGIRITATPVSDPNGMIAQFNLTNQASGMFVYYKDKNNKPATLRIVIDKNCKNFSHIDYDFNGSTISAITNDTLKSEDYNNTMYVGGLGVAMTKISIDSIIDWYMDTAIKNSAINEAVLVLPIATNNPANRYPAQLYCAYDTAGVMKYVDDMGNIAYFDGLYDKQNKEYRMRITQHLFACIQNKHLNHNLYIFVPTRAANPYRVILGKPKLEITYSRR